MAQAASAPTGASSPGPRSASPRASSSSSSAPPGRASRRCSGASTASCPTSRAALSTAGSPWTAATPVTTGRVTSPTSSGSWCRTRCRPSSRTPSRRRLPTAWKRWGWTRPRCAAGSRRPSTCSASPTSGAGRCATSPAASSSAWRSVRCWPRVPASWCSTSRPRPSTPSPRRMSWPPCTASSMTSASRSSSRSTAWSASSTTPTGWSSSATERSLACSTRRRPWCPHRSTPRSSAWAGR